MNFLILEDYPFICREHLSYLEKKWHTIFDYWSKCDLEKIEGIIMNIKTIDKNLLNNFPNLKYICRKWVWLDMIDLDECKKRWIKVLNTPLANFSSVSDIVVMWVIRLLRKTYKSFNTIRDRLNFMWRELSEVSVWILWFWNIWKSVYKKLSWVWVNKFWIYDPFVKKEDICKNQWCSKIEDTEFIYKNYDVIVFTLPLFPETRHILSWNDYKLLKKDAIIVNVSRWWIVDEDWLLKFLEENHDAWAYLDVWEWEPNPPKSSLKKLENCIITPHIGAMTKKAYINMHYFKELDT